jgi:23S rRNA pseudouridine2604 synthase
MTFKNPLQYLLVKRLQISNKAALSMIIEGKITVNRVVVFENIIITESDEIYCGTQLLNEGKNLLYVAFYKPKGIETTLNTTISSNLKGILPFEEDLFPAGRLDKASEGLLLLTNDGRLFHKILRQEHCTEKEYIVSVDKAIDDDFIQKMSNGIVIMGKKTLSCEVEKLDSFSFRIVLIQGLNRQIRRMCYKLNCEVLSLKRIRIGNVLLGDLQASEFRFLEQNEL